MMADKDDNNGNTVTSETNKSGDGLTKPLNVSTTVTIDDPLQQRLYTRLSSLRRRFDRIQGFKLYLVIAIMTTYILFTHFVSLGLGVHSNSHDDPTNLHRHDWSHKFKESETLSVEQSESGPVTTVNETESTNYNQSQFENEWSPLHPEQSDECTLHYDMELIELARDDTFNVCADKIDDDDRAFCSSTKHLNTCHFQGAQFNDNGQWVLPCSLVGRGSDKLFFPKDWYSAGPGNQFIPLVNQQRVMDPTQCTEWIEETTIILTPECRENMFHSFSEYLGWYAIRHFYHISDYDRNVRYILQCPPKAARDPAGPYPTADYVTDHPWAPIYFQRLSMYPVQPMSDVPKGTCYRNLVTGRQMMGWYKFWESLGNCHSTQLMLSFVSFWKSAFEQHIGHINTVAERRNPKVHLCWLERLNHTRGWPEHQQFFDGLARDIADNEEHRKLFANVEIDIVTPGYLEYEDTATQYQAISKCNILAGTHGAGMTWNIFMKKPGVMIYVKPIKTEYLDYGECGVEGCWHDGFVNWAQMTGNTVLFAHSRDPTSNHGYKGNGQLMAQKLQGVDTVLLKEKIIEAVQIIKTQ